MIGSAAGGAFRHWLSLGAARWWGVRFPWGTLAVNVSGAVLVGMLAAVAARALYPFASEEARHLLVVGLCGGYTTVSSFALQTLSLAREARWAAAMGNVAASFGLSVAGVGMGYVFASRWLGG